MSGQNQTCLDILSWPTQNQNFFQYLLLGNYQWDMFIYCTKLIIRLLPVQSKMRQSNMHIHTRTYTCCNHSDINDSSIVNNNNNNSNHYHTTANPCPPNPHHSPVTRSNVSRFGTCSWYTWSFCLLAMVALACTCSVKFFTASLEVLSPARFLGILPMVASFLRVRLCQAIMAPWFPDSSHIQLW